MLSWNPHIRQLELKLARCCGVLFRLRKFLDSKILKLIYYALFESIVTYACEVWGNSNVNNIDKLIKLQKRAIRCVYKQHYLAHTQPLFEKSKIQPLRKIIKK